MELTEKARNAYKEMVQSLENEATEYSQRAPSSMSAGFPTLHAHLGHSRTPSACSAISFTSSILSEPISENYPQSEPETDSKGYEIVKADEKKKNEKTEPVKSEIITPVASQENVASKPADVDGDDNNNKDGEVLMSGGLMDNSLNEIDEGHEADTEDTAEQPHKTNAATTGAICSKRPATQQESRNNQDDDEEDMEDEDTDSQEEEEDPVMEDSNDTVEELPHIDSIHTSTLDLPGSSDLLSQHSSTLNLEVMSTHSSKTLGECSSTVNTEHTLIERHRHSSGKGGATELAENALDGGTNKTRPIDKDRIESWIAETQSHMDDLDLSEKEAPTSEATLSESDEKVDDSASDEVVRDACLKSVSLEKLDLGECDTSEESGEGGKGECQETAC